LSKLFLQKDIHYTS